MALCVLWVAAGACAELEDNEGTPTSLTTAESQPSVANTTGNANVPQSATPSVPKPIYAILPAEAKTGVAVRWQRDATKCIARKTATPTLNDPVILSTCANTNAQAWVVHGGYMMADANLCVGGGNIGNALSMLLCTDHNAQAFVFNGGATNAYTFAGGGLFADDANGVVGSPVRLGNYTSAPDYSLARWNLTGVGTQIGSIVSFGTSANQCMALGAGSLKVSSCSATDTNQRWSLFNGDLASNTNVCIVGTSPDPGLAIIACASVSNTATNNQGWYVYQVIRYASLYNVSESWMLAMDSKMNGFEMTMASLSNTLGTYYWGGRLVLLNP